MMQQVGGPADASIDNQLPAVATGTVKASGPLETASSDVAPWVGIAYHFFAHYRGGICEELIKSHRYHFQFFGDTQDPDKAGIKPHDFSDLSRLTPIRSRSLVGPVLWQSGLMKLACRRDIRTIIYLGSPWFISTWCSAIVARILGKRVLFWTHGWYSKDRGLRLWFKNLYYRLAHALLVYEHASKALGISNGFDPARIHVVHNSLDYARQLEVRASVSDVELAERKRRCFGPSVAPCAIYIGRLIAQKKVHQIIEAAKQLHGQGHEVNLLIVGDGPERAALEALANNYQITAYFFGACYEEAMSARLLMLADVMVSPGNVGLNAIHSLTYGTPVITHDDPDLQGPEVEAIWPGVSGDFFELDNVDDLASKIRNWTTSPISDDARGQARRLVERFYNPGYQRTVIERAVAGAPADDLFWLKTTVTTT